MSHATAWALAWMNEQMVHGNHVWHPLDDEIHALIQIASNPARDSEAVRFLSWIFKEECSPGALDALLLHLTSRSANTRSSAAEALGAIGDARAVDGLLSRWEDRHEKTEVRQTAAQALGAIGDPRAVDGLLSRFEDRQEKTGVRQTAARALGAISDPRGIEALRASLADEDWEIRCLALEAMAKTCENRTDLRLLSQNFDDAWPYLDPQEPVTEARVVDAAAKLGQPAEEIRRRYEALHERFGLRLAWR